MSLNHLFMVPLNYLTTFVRSFRRNIGYSSLNLLGLALGFTVFILAAVYVHFETHFEEFHPKADRTYRATYRYTPPGDYKAHWARIPFDYINELPQDVRGIETLIRFQNHARKYIRVAEEKFRPEHVYVTDPKVFDVFNFRLSSGDPGTALKEPYSVVISETLAARYFAGEEAIGKELFVISDLDSAESLHRVTGVMKDLPANTHLPVDMLISFRNPAERTGWAYTYILLEDGTDIATIDAAMRGFIDKHSPEGVGKDDAILFQPLKSIHLGSNLAREIVPNSKHFYVRLVGVAGLLILLVAVINFTNLNGAMSLRRAREVGIRKVMGAAGSHVAGYFVAESLAYHVAALAIAAGISYALFPLVQTFVTAEVLPSAWSFLSLVPAVAVVCGIAAGLYPALLLTSLKPAAVLKTSKSLALFGKERAFSFKRVMVTLQFAVSILLVASALIAHKQFQYLLERNPGMERDQVIALAGVPDQVKDKYESFRGRLEGQRGIVGVSACMEVPSREIRDAGPVLVEGVNSDPSKAPVLDIQIIDANFPEMMGLKFVAGNTFARRTPATAPRQDNLPEYLLKQERRYLINETAMRALGWSSPQDAIGRRISWSIGDVALASGPITGVVQDFHQESLKNKVDPLIMLEEPVWFRTFLVKIDGSDVAGSIEKVSRAWNELFPFYPMEYHFLDDLYENLYKGERVQVQILFLCSGLAIFLAFTGLLGLVAYSLKSRTKEMAVRKVLGAGFADLLKMLGSEYVVLLLVGSAIATPLSVYGVSDWLSGFAYRINVSPANYVIAVLLTAGLLLTTMALQTLLTAKINPASTLRED